MATVVREMAKLYKYLIDDISDPRTQSWPFVYSPVPIFTFVGCYVYFVKVLGPRWMQDRKPFNVDRIMQVYNVVQIMLSVYVLERALTLGWLFKYNWFCQPVDYSNDPEALQVARTVYHVYFIKIFDLMDTVFFVLRKKNSQVTFLHVYHHGGMACFLWAGVKYLPGGHGTFLGFVNSIVHIVMYSYYLITSIYPKHKKNIWWKKYITQLQMVQFAAITLHTLQLAWVPYCGFPRWAPLFLVPQNAFMFAMFYDFYRKAYTPQKMAEGMRLLEEEDKKTA